MNIPHEKRNYKLIQRVGKGGMGMVYRAIELETGRTVAIKALRDEIKNDKTLVKRFLREAETVGCLHHPNIVELYNVVEEDNLFYLVFEFLDGENLDKILDEYEYLSFEEAMNVVLQISEALKYAHGNKIMHRDLKPSNIMILDRGGIKVMDFGIAREVSDIMTKLTGTTEHSGTLSYMAPEQHLGQECFSSDIFALGVTFYEMLTGELPFQGSDLYACKNEMAYEPPSKLKPELPAEADMIVKACLQADPEKRPESILDI